MAKMQQCGVLHTNPHAHGNEYSDADLDADAHTDANTNAHTPHETSPYPYTHAHTATGKTGRPVCDSHADLNTLYGTRTPDVHTYTIHDADPHTNNYPHGPRSTADANTHSHPIRARGIRHKIVQTKRGGVCRPFLLPSSSEVLRPRRLWSNP